MQVIVSGKQLDLTPSLHEYCQEKLGLLDRYWSEIINIHVELGKNQHHKHGDVFSVSVRVEVPGKDIRARTEAAEMHAAIDLIADTLRRQIIKAKQRLSRTA